MKTKNDSKNVVPADLQQGAVSGVAFDDNYLDNNILEARNDHDKACEIYRNYVGSSETREERLRRIHRFRCGGW